MFCWRAKYSRTFFIKLISGYVIAGTLLNLAYPEVNFLLPFLGLMGAVVVVGLIACAFDIYTYRRYIKKLPQFYQEQNAASGYEISFDQEHLFFYNDETPWSTYRFYYIGEQDIYIFKNRCKLALAWSANSMDKEAFVDLISCTKKNLKYLPAARGIIIKGLAKAIFSY